MYSPVQQMARYSKDMPLTVTWTSSDARQKQTLVAANWNQFFTVTEMACRRNRELTVKSLPTHIYRGDKLSTSSLVTGSKLTKHLSLIHII